MIWILFFYYRKLTLMDLMTVVLSFAISATLVCLTWALRRVLFSIEGFRMNMAFEYFWKAKESLGAFLDPAEYSLETDPQKIIVGRTPPLTLLKEIDIVTPDFMWGVKDECEFIFIVTMYAQYETGRCGILEYVMYIRNATGLRSYGNLRNKSASKLFLDLSRRIRQKIQDNNSMIA